MRNFTQRECEPNEEKFFTFTWTPEYAGEFRTFSEIYDDVKKTTIGSVPQFDFQVIQPDKLDPNYDYFPTYRIMDLDNEYLIGDPIEPYVLKKDLNGCNGYHAKIIAETTRQRVWEYQFSSSCVVLDTLPEVESKIYIPSNQKPIIIDELGDYVLKIDMGTYEIQKRFSIVEKYSQLVIENGVKTDDDYNFIGNDLTPPESEPIPTKEQLTDAQIFCIEGYKQVGSECVPDDDLKIFNYEIFYIVLLIVLVVISFVMIYVWRK